MTEQFTCVRFADDITTVVGITNGSDECYAEDFLKQQDDKDLARFQRYFQFLEQNHRLKSPEVLRHLETWSDLEGSLAKAELYELKTHNHGGRRLYLVKFESTWYATHGTKKQKDRLAKQEWTKAQKIWLAARVQSEDET